MERFGLGDDNEIKNLEKLSRQDVSDLVGLTSNQVTKVLAEFNKEKLIEIKGKRIIILNKTEIERLVAI